MKRNFKKLVSIIAVLALSLSVFTACKNKTDTPKTDKPGTEDSTPTPKPTEAADKEAVNITWYESTDNEAFAKAIADAFNASQTEVVVELVTIPNDDYETKTKTMLSGGSDDIDVFHVNGVAMANSYGANEVTYDLTDFLQNTTLDLDNFSGKIEYSTLDNGYVAAMPEGWGGWFLYYNKDMFDAAGLDYPELLTWD